MVLRSGLSVEQMQRRWPDELARSRDVNTERRKAVTVLAARMHIAKDAADVSRS
jgi:hypothetical protein